MELNFLGKYIGKDDVVANYVKKCKLNEQIYENTIKKLQENNMRLMDELAQFKEDWNIRFYNILEVEIVGATVLKLVYLIIFISS